MNEGATFTPNIARYETLMEAVRDTHQKVIYRD